MGSEEEMRETIKTRIINVLENSSKKPVSIEELSEALHIHHSKEHKELVKAIAVMEREHSIEFTKSGKIRLSQGDILLEGIFSGHERGFGFVSVEGEEDIFISPENTGFALNGDRVKVDILHPANPFAKKGAEGKVVEIEERGSSQVVGEFTAFEPWEVAETELYGYVIAKDKKLSGYKVMIAAEGIRPDTGSICIVELTHYPEPGYQKSLEGMIKQVIGHKNDPGMDILAIVLNHGIQTDFPEDVLVEAENISETISEDDLFNRKDLRDQVIVTIDGADAKDLDDAVTVRKLENGNYFLGVHIADVSHYVQEGNALDREAFERGTSVYLTDRVIPMLPRKLSNGICSLNPKVPRLTISCEMEIDPNGKVVAHDIFPSVIQTTERMTYQAVNEILEDENAETILHYQALVPMFQEMNELHHILEKMREKRGAISFEDREAKIIVDDSGKPLDIELRKRGTGERLIESFMLVANETVAEHFHRLQLPFIYRIHEHPREDAIQRFFGFLSTLGIPIKGTKEDVSPKELQKVLDAVKGKPEEPIISMMLLKSMQQAKYSEQAEGHYGLAAPFYTHFTSPIRRYPDLIVHRLIRLYSQKSVSEKIQSIQEESLPDIAVHSSRMERRSVDAEREVDAMKKAEYMLEHIGDEFDGIISSVMKFGLFVELPNTIEGLVHISKMKEDYFEYVESQLALVGERTGRTYKIGQKVRIKVTKSDPELREIDFELLVDDQVPVSNRPSKKRRGTHKQTPVEKKTKKGTAKSKNRKPKKKPFYEEIAKQKKTVHKKKKKTKKK